MVFYCSHVFFGFISAKTDPGSMLGFGPMTRIQEVTPVHQAFKIKGAIQPGKRNNSITDGFSGPWYDFH